MWKEEVYRNQCRGLVCDWYRFCWHWEKKHTCLLEREQQFTKEPVVGRESLVHLPSPMLKEREVEWLLHTEMHWAADVKELNEGSIL